MSRMGLASSTAISLTRAAKSSGVVESRVVLQVSMQFICLGGVGAVWVGVDSRESG